MEVPPAAGPAPPSPSLFSRLHSQLVNYLSNYCDNIPHHSPYFFVSPFIFAITLTLNIFAVGIVSQKIVRLFFSPPSHSVDHLCEVVLVLLLMVCLQILGHRVYSRVMEIVKGKCGQPRGAREDVLMDPHLLTKILESLVAGDRASVATRKTLGDCALVSKSWKDTSRADLLWRPIVARLLPAAADALVKWWPLAERSKIEFEFAPPYFIRFFEWWGPSVDRSENEFAPYLIRYGKLLMTRKDSLVNVPAAINQLVMGVEIFDSGDRFCYLSATGPACVRSKDISLDDRLNTCYATNAFSVASRDPEQHRYPNIQEYFGHAHEAQSPACICIRICIMCERTKKTVMLLDVKPGHHFIVRQHTNGAWRVRTAGVIPLLENKGGATDLIEAFPYFSLRPVPDQSADVSDEEKMWQFETESYAFGFGVDASDRFYKFILSLLDINQLERKKRDVHRSSIWDYEEYE